MAASRITSVPSGARAALSCQPPQLRILMLCKAYPPLIGGGGSHAAWLADALARQPEVAAVHVLTDQVASGLGPHGSNSPLPPKLTVERIDFSPMGSPPMQGALAKALATHRQFRPNVIHAQHIEGAYLGLQLKAAFGTHLAVTLHKTPSEHFTVEMTRTDPLFSFMHFLVKSKLVDVFFAGSKAFDRQLTDLGVDGSNRAFSYHGVPAEWFRYHAFKCTGPQDIGLDPDSQRTLIICPCRIDDERKDIRVFLRAAALLLTSPAGKHLKFLLTGDRERSSTAVEELTQLSKDLNIEANVMFRSFDYERMPALYRFSFAAVLPTRREGLGLVVLEAWASGTPIVASRALGVTEMIDDGRDGLLFEGEREIALADQIQRLLGEPRLRGELVRNGRRRTRREFSAKRMAQEHVDAYHALWKEKGPAEGRPLISSEEER